MSITRSEINEMIKERDRIEVAFDYGLLRGLVKDIASKRMPSLIVFLDFGDMNPNLAAVYHTLRIVMEHSIYRRRKIQEFYQSIHG